MTSNPIAQEIRTVVNQAEALFLQLTPDQVAMKATPDQWSKKEVLGHLIDSAANNHHRFVRAAYNAAMTFPPYNKMEWVRIQGYHESDWTTLVAFWSVYNRHLCDVIERIPAEAFSAPCNIGKEAPVPLEFIIQDYLRHLQHHVNQILEKKA